MKGEHSLAEMRRILVALDASPESLAALEAAVAFARRTQAELLGLFVEDAEWLEAAASPYAREILYPSARTSAPDRAALERGVRQRSEEARQSLRSAAEEASLRWSFHCVRGTVAAELLSAGTQADLVVLGRCGWRLGAPTRLGSTARRIAESSLPAMLFSGRDGAIGEIFVVYDGSGPAQQALALGVELARADSGVLRVLLEAGSEAAAASLRAQAASATAAANLTVHYRGIRPQEPADIQQALREAPDPALLTGLSEGAPLPAAIRTILQDTKVPVLLLRVAA